MKRIVLILLGPTAVGKTSLSLSLASLLKTEIISSDSMQIYRFMDIGTAKPSSKQREEIRHHMIDIVNPWEYFSTGEYIERVRDIIEKLFIEGKIPLVVGGTGLYIRAMTEGIFQGPDADWSLRNRLIREESLNPGSLYGRLKEVDPDSASKINPADMRRIIRALEVYYSTGKTISDMQRGLTKPLPYQFLKIGITRERGELYSIIERRVDEMLKAGLVEEVREVLTMINRNSKDKLIPLPAFQAIGYKEIGGYLADFYVLSEAVRLIKKRTKMYAKRQFTWFKKEEGIRWFDISGRRDFDKIAEEIYEKILEFLN